MQGTDYKRKINAMKTENRSVSQTIADFPRRHLFAASIALGVLFFALLLTPGQDIQAKRTSQPIALAIEPTPTPLPKIVAPEALPTWKDIKVKSGDNLSLIFQRASLGAKDVHELVSSNKKTNGLLRLLPGQTLSFHINDEGKLQALRHTQSLTLSTLFERNGEKFTTTQIERTPEVRKNYSSATISNSLYRAAQNSGLSQNLIMELANIFGGVVDFIYDVRAGDSFTVLYEEHYLDSNKTGDGPILAAQFTNRGTTYTAYRYRHKDNSIGYYNEEGVSMRKAFLRAPVDFTRISSSFNLKRLHPIFKTTKPHRGIDYAAATGTPVYAVGDGRISRAGYSKANGNYVVINHGTEYQTKYLHLNKRAVKKGQKVKQQQIIGWVGSTGYATGPHLHYEFLVNGVHRNPRTILKKLPKAKSIKVDDRALFLAQVSSLQMQLAAYNNHSQLATADQIATGSTSL